MSNRMLPIEAVIELTGLARRTLYQEISGSRFPKPVQLTARRVGWPAQEVEAWIAAKIAERDKVVA